MRQGKVVPLNAKQKLAEANYLLGESRNIALTYLSTLLQRMLDNADDALFELADKAESDQDQNSYFDAMRELRLTRQSLEGGFREQLKGSFNTFLRAPAAQTETPSLALDSDNMSLVDELDLEESLAVNGMVTKVMSRYPHELYAIEQRFQAIAGNNKPPMERIPIGPKAICQAFHESVKALDGDIKIKLIIYKLFDRHVLANLRPLYDETNVLFVSAGILPKLKMQVNKQPGGDHHPPRRQAPPEDIAWLDDSAVSPTQASLDDGAGFRESLHSSALDTLRDLLSLQRSGADGHPSGHTCSGMESGAPAELITVLSDLQRLNLTTAAGTMQAELANLKESAKVSAVDRDIIDIVDMLFDFILDDDHLPAIAGALLARLQIPMIKVALVDREFFGAKQHPAKKLLNLMAKASVGLGNDIRRENCPLIEKIDAIVSRICSEFSDDVTIFTTLLQEFEQFLAEETEHERQSQAASRQRILEREQQTLSRGWVTEVIASAINNRRLPKPVFEFLDGPWKEVMINTYLNDSRDSEHWKENLRFIDLLIWSVEPGEPDRQRLGRIIPQLIRTLRDELQQVHYPPEQLDALLDELQALHLAKLRGETNTGHKTVKVRTEPSVNIHAADPTREISRELDAMRESLSEFGDADKMMDELLSDINPDHPESGYSRKQAMAAELFCEDDVEEIVMSSTFVNEKTIPEIDDHYWAMVQQLQPGQWISLIDDKGKPQKIKLSWKSDMLGECTFINWKFKVAADLTFNQLAASFRAGQAALVDNLPIFERAVDAVINSLQRRQAN